MLIAHASRQTSSVVPALALLSPPPIDLFYEGTLSPPLVAYEQVRGEGIDASCWSEGGAHRERSRAYRGRQPGGRGMHRISKSSALRSMLTQPTPVS